MSRTIRVLTGARLHFGLLAVNSALRRNFGGVGLMVDVPGCTLSVRAADRDEIIAPRDISERLATWLAMTRQSVSVKQTPPACRIEVESALPMHAGFGSGTQTALALAMAVAFLANEPDVAVTELARRVGRGLRSALGIHGFASGGFLVEGGKRYPDEISPLVTRLSFPDDWRLLLIAPHETSGLSGDAERTAFARLAPMSESVSDRLCRIALLDLLPAVASSDFDATSVALSEFGRLNGEYFAEIQGGVFANRRMASVADWLSGRGILGVAQTSWGPTICALCDDPDRAESLRNDLSIASQSEPLSIVIAAPKNRGVEISIHES